jgi:hypothetical protein
MANGYTANAVAVITTTAANAAVDRRRTDNVPAVTVGSPAGRESRTP